MLHLIEIYKQADGPLATHQGTRVSYPDLTLNRPVFSFRWVVDDIQNAGPRLCFQSHPACETGRTVLHVSMDSRDFEREGRWPSRPDLLERKWQEVFARPFVFLRRGARRA